MSTPVPASAGLGADRGQTRPQPHRRVLRRYLPPQHGAWAMLLLPWLAGVLTTGLRWPHLPLLAAWVTGYLCSYHLLLAARTRRPGLVRAQLVVFGVPTALLGGLVLAAQPALLWYGPGYALLLAVNVAHSSRRDERALVNRLVAVAQSCLLVPVCATVAGAPLTAVATTVAVLAAYLTGSVLHVKTMIRERGSVGHRRASVGFHLLAAGGAWWLGPVAAGVFALLLIRAWALPGRRLRPVHVGVVEIGASLLVLIVAVVG